MVKSDEAWFEDKHALALDAELKKRAEKIPLLIFDFTSIDEMHPQALRTLTRITSGLSQNETKTAFIVTHKISTFITVNGMNRILRCFESLEDIAPKMSPPQEDKARTLEFLNTTLDAAIYTFKVATNTEVTPQKTVIRNGDNGPPHEVAAMVGLVSPQFQGTLVLAFPGSTYLPIMNRLTGGDFKELTPEIRDGVAELLNIVVGQAKTSLNQKGYQLQQAIPTLVQGGKIFTAASPATRSVIVPFTCDAGPFFIELTTNSRIPS
jgi:chemotaxis protein CheX